MKKLSQSTSTSRRTLRSAAESVLTYFDMRCEAFTSALSAAQAFYAVEGIHELRVEVKRLRALYKQIEYVAPSFAAKPNTSSLKPLFRAAGELRDIDICQAITLKRLRMLDLNEYFNHLKQSELRLRESFSGISELFSKTALSSGRAQIRSALTATNSQRMPTRMVKRIMKLTAELTALANRNNRKSDDLHSVRKVSKALRYTLDVWQQCYGKNPAAGTASAQLKRTYGYLGEWRDTLLTLESVETFLKHKSKKDTVNPAAYVTFQEDLRGRTKRLIAAYDRGRKPLQSALNRLCIGLRRELDSHKASTG